MRWLRGRIAINTPVQEPAADILKIAMVALNQRIEAECPDAQMLLTVHDELVLEVPQDRLEQTLGMVREVMEGAVSLARAARRRCGLREPLGRGALNWRAL